VGGVLVENACGSPLGMTSWQHAISMVVTAEADVVVADPDRQVRSPSMAVAFPRVIRMRRWVFVKYFERQDPFEGGFATRHGVLLRDSYTCVYCGKPGDTIDHVFPQSRGGANTWENLAACCKSCNQAKADRTPEEAGMRLRWHPYKPDVTGYTQRRIKRDLEPAV